MGIVLTILGVLGGLLGLVSLVCWIMVLVKMFQDEVNGGIAHAIGGFICGLYALYWGWTHKEQHDLQKIMQIWIAAIIGSIVLSVLQGVMAGMA